MSGESLQGECHGHQLHQLGRIERRIKVAQVGA
jgi:hypothetical protein